MNVTTQGIGHKVMSVLMALVLAIGLAPMVPAGNAWADEAEVPANEQAVWEGMSVKYNVEPENNVITVTEGESVGVESIVDPASGKELDESAYKVLFFDQSDAKIVDAVDSLTGQAGGTPKAPGKYRMLIAKTSTIPADYWAGDGDTWATWTAAGIVTRNIEVIVEAAEISVKGAFAYQYVSGDKAEMGDREFKYTGNAINVAIAVGEDTLVNGDYSARWTEYPKNVDPSTIGWDGTCWTVTQAGTYTLHIAGVDGKYTDEEDVTFTVDQIDLETDVITADNAVAGSVPLYTGENIYVNGEKIHKDALKVAPYSYANTDGVSMVDFANMDVAGKYTYTVTAMPGNESNVTGKVLVDVYVGQNAVTFEYDNQAWTTAFDKDPFVFQLDEDEAFDPSKISAHYMKDGKEVAVTPQVTVIKDGKVVNSYAEPGKYELQVNAVDEEGFVYAGNVEQTFYVYKGVLDSPVAYMTVDGKYVTDANNSFTYTQDAMAVAVTVKDGDKVLTSGEDFQVSLSKDGEAVDEVRDAGDYVATITFDGYTVNDPEKTVLEIPFTVEKATIVTVKPVTEEYGAIALPADGSAAKVAFVGYTADSKIEYTLDPATLQVVYKLGGEIVEADELTVAGEYTADVFVLGTNANLEGGQDGVAFILTDKVSFDDVDANAWYADEVYKATDNGYVKGMGNKLFFPEAQMTRAQFAQVVYNMAGEPAVDENESGTYPTKFADVDGSAWYAKAVSWANEAGIVNGTSETTFEPESTISREEIATMLYRYAGNGAEADASALDAFVDGDQVCDWAETAMAWAVENGYMNGKGANDLQPHATATRAEVAALSVRVQPKELEKPLV